MNFASLPDRRAHRDPHGPAVADGNQSLSNVALLARVQAAAAHLRDLGVGLGDVVALNLTNRVEFVVLLFASWRLGATVTPLNPSMTEIEAARQTYKLLAVEADNAEDAEKYQEDLEAAIRLARMDLRDLQALKIPSQCNGCCSGDCNCKGKKPGKKPGKKKAEDVRGASDGAPVDESGH